MNPADEILFLEGAWKFLKGKELDALEAKQMADEITFSEIRDYCFKRIAFLQALQSQ